MDFTYVKLRSAELIADETLAIPYEIYREIGESGRQACRLI